MLELSSESVNFEPASPQSSVFFDDANCKVVTVRGSGAIGVTGKGPSPHDVLTFRLADKGDVLGLKMAPSLRTAAVQRSRTSLDFVNIHGGEVEGAEYSQGCKAKGARILGFQWTGLAELLLVTDKGLELLTLLPEKRTLKPCRTHNIAVNWYVYDPDTQLLLVSSGVYGTSLHPFLVRGGQLLRLGKLEVDLGAPPQPPKLTLLDRDVSIATVYGKPSVLVLKHNARGPSQVLVYELAREATAESGGRKRHELQLARSGKFALQVPPSLIPPLFPALRDLCPRRQGLRGAACPG